MKYKSRNKNMRKKLIIILGVIVVVFGLSIVYAALTSSLNIVGRTDVEGNTWSITFNINNADNNGWTAKPTVDDGIIRFAYMSFDVPGEYAEFEVEITNNGLLLAELKDIIIGTPVCSSDTGNTDDEKLICDNIDISLKYADGSLVEIGDILYQFRYDGNPVGTSAVCKQTDLEESLALSTRSKREVIVNITYNKDVDKVPSSKVTVTGLDIQFLFEQTNNSCKYELGSFF